MSRILRAVLQLTVIWALELGLLLALVYFLPGVTIEGTPTAAMLARAGLAALMIGGVNLAIRPALIWLRIPPTLLAAGAAVFAVNIALSAWAIEFVPQLEIARFWSTAAASGFWLAVANSVLNSLYALDDDYTYLQFVLGALRERSDAPPAPTQTLHAPLPARGLLMLEIDGLSHDRLIRAMTSGLTPTLARWVARGTHTLAKFDCGVPSMTSACQAGLMYGRNDDIPGFRWYDKRARRMRVSNHLRDAYDIDRSVATGDGLLAGGTSINNLLSGGAAVSLLTLSTLGEPAGDTRDNEASDRATSDLNAFWLNPFNFSRTLVLCGVDFVRELAQAARQILRNEKPRLNRFRHGGYQALRVLTNVFLRDLTASVVMRQIMRGSPVIYASFIGYDEVAHHAGPDTQDALRTLRGFDANARHIDFLIKRFAPMPYDVVVLSDHGHSGGASFEQRSGGTLRSFIDAHTGESNVAELSTRVEAGRSFLAALLSELDAAEDQLTTRPNTRIRRGAIRSTQRTLAPAARESAADTGAGAGAHHDIVVCPSGNLAHVYINSGDGAARLPISHIEAVYPGLISALVQQECVGFVVALSQIDADGPLEPVALGKLGARALGSGAITGQDPLAPYGDAEARAQQLLRLAKFNNAGDLILNSTLYPDGSVAAFEPLVGSHGGLGGQQTEPFVLYPEAMAPHLPRNAGLFDVYALLRAQRRA